MEIISYFILLFGIVGIALGLYGLVVPALRQRGLRIRLPRVRKPSLPNRGSPRNGIAAVDNLIAELEQAGFRGSPFEAKAAVTALAVPVTLAARRVEAPLAVVIPPEMDLDVPDEELEAILEEVVTAEAYIEADAGALPAMQPAAEIAEDTAMEPEPVAAAVADPLNAESDLLSFFEEATAESTTPAVLREAISEISAQELLVEARELRAIMGGSNK